MKKLRLIFFGILFIVYAIVYASTAYEFYIRDYFEAAFLLLTSIVITVLPIWLWVRAFNRARRPPITARS